MKACTICGIEKPLSEFHKRKASRDGLKYYCKSCAYEMQARWRERNSATIPERQRRHKLKRFYGITLEQFRDLLKKQGGRCKVCGTTQFGGKGPIVDHCHKTNYVRALLCTNCNIAEGHLKTAKNAHAMLKYMEAKELFETCT